VLKRQQHCLISTGSQSTPFEHSREREREREYDR
jgi:hypothetical protein